MEQLSNVLPAIFGELIPLASIVLGIGIAFWAMYLGHQRRRMQFEERRLMIEKGLTPPPLPVEMRRRSPQATLRVGIILVFLGIGLGLAAVISQGASLFVDPHGLGRALAIAACIVTLLGIGNLVVYAVTRKEPASIESGSTPPLV